MTLVYYGLWVTYMARIQKASNEKVSTITSSEEAEEKHDSIITMQ